MTTTVHTTARAEELGERLFNATIGTLELYSVHLGRSLGLYEVLADGASRTAADLARDAGVAERYAREWLEQQAVAGILTVEDADAANGNRRFQLDAEHARVLADAQDPLHVAPFGALVAGIGQALPEVVEAYRTGAGVPYVRYGSDFRDGQGGINRPAFTHDLVGEWLPALPDVHRRLVDGARVADIGCGQGWSTQALARAYPASRVIGIDGDARSIADARAALPEDLAGTVRFEHADATQASGPFDVIFMFEALHDLGRPVEALASMRAALADDGTVIVVDERVADAFEAPGDEVERLMYGWSVVHCLPAAVADGDHGALGTVLRADMVRQLAGEAGFRNVEVLPIDNDLFRFYRLTV
jgi:SAM-dependent methyltransferase